MNYTYGDEQIAEWLDENEYHPRSPAHGSASCLYLLTDLLQESEKFRKAAEAGEIVFQEDYTVGEDESRWNADLVVGPPKGDDIQLSLDNGLKIVEAEPERIWLAVDAKSVMTEHGKARRNRQRDINSFADIMHHHHPGAVTGGLMLINMSDRFKSPLRDEDDITEHDNIEQLVQETVEIFRDIERAQGDVSPNVDAAGCVVVDHTNLNDGKETTLVTEPPAPQVGDIVHYRDFLEIVTETLEERWLTGEPPEITSAAESEDLEVVLNHSIVELAHLAHMVGGEIDNGKVSTESLEGINEEISEIEGVVEEIRRRHTEE